MEKQMITVEAIIEANVQKVWNSWTVPEHITNWCFASDDWCAPKATNDLRKDGHFMTRMEAKDGSFGFDFNGVYTVVDPPKKLAYIIEDGREVTIDFISQGASCKVIETFEAESQNPVEMQRAGWQAILNNFKKYTEAH